MLRSRMVEEQLVPRGIRRADVLEAMGAVPRHLFVPVESREFSYEDRPLPLPGGQTISQPFMVAKVSELLELSGRERVLEIGVGCGYQAAILGRLAAEVFGVDVVPELVRSAETNLSRIAARNVHVRLGDGKRGWPERSPFDRIVASCAVRDVPPGWHRQLEPGGLLVFPLEAGDRQVLCRWRKEGPGWGDRQEFFEVRYVPLV